MTLNADVKIDLLRSVTVRHSAKVEVNGEEITLCVGNGEDEPAEPVVDVLTGLDLSELEDSPAALAMTSAMFKRHASVFASSEDDLRCTDAIKHRINTTDVRPVTQLYRRVPPAQFEKVKAPFEKLLRTGLIVPSHSDYASSIVLVRKKSRALRMCDDFVL